MTSWQNRIQQALSERQQQSLWRQQSQLTSQQQSQVSIIDRDQPLLNFCSNDYLGLAADGASDLAHAAKQWGFGSGASHLVCGHSQAHHELEQALAQHIGYPRALLLSSGFSANLALLSCLVTKGDVIYQDKINHASLIDGALLSRAQLRRYRHNSVEHLSQLLERHENSAGLSLIATDSVFSMDGDVAPLDELITLCQPSQRQLFVDDAHGFGVLGHRGQGCLHHYPYDPQTSPIYMGTLGKALGGYGAFIAGSDELIDYLIQFARPYIYSTAMPPALAEAMLGQLTKLQGGDRQQQLHKNIHFFKQQAAALNIELMPSETAIQPLLIGDSAKAILLSQQLRQNGYWVGAIRPPTVPTGTARLRITLTAKHTQAEISGLLETIQQLHCELGRGAK